MRGIEAQFLALQKGFSELIPQHLLKPFDHKELEVHVLSVNNKPVIIMNDETLFTLGHLCFFLISFSPSCPVDHRRPGEDRPRRLEDEHPPEALHK